MGSWDDSKVGELLYEKIGFFTAGPGCHGDLCMIDISQGSRVLCISV